MECSYEPSFIIFNFGGGRDAFFGSTMPFIRQDYKLHSLINPIIYPQNYFGGRGCLFLHLIIISYIVIPWQVEPMFVK
jgi:hypothetical protein